MFSFLFPDESNLTQELNTGGKNPLLNASNMYNEKLCPCDKVTDNRDGSSRAFEPSFRTQDSGRAFQPSLRPKIFEPSIRTELELELELEFDPSLTDNRIVGGQDTNIHEFPWQAALVMYYR